MDTQDRTANFAVGCILAPLGLVVGGVTWVALSGSDPFGVTSFPLPRGVSVEVAQAAFERWRRSPGVIAGGLAMCWISLLPAALCGVFAHRSLPASIPGALLRMVGVTLVLAAAMEFGAPVAEDVLGTGGSSDIQGAVAGLAFTGLCLSLAAPLSSAVTRRRSPGRRVTNAES